METERQWNLSGLKQIAEGAVYQNDQRTTYQPPALQREKAQAVVNAFAEKDAGDSWAQYFIYVKFLESIIVATSLYTPQPPKEAQHVS
jgi:hypothetical protein